MHSLIKILMKRISFDIYYLCLVSKYDKLLPECIFFTRWYIPVSPLGPWGPGVPESQRYLKVIIIVLFKEILFSRTWHWYELKWFNVYQVRRLLYISLKTFICDMQIRKQLSKYGIKRMICQQWFKGFVMIRMFTYNCKYFV